MMDFKAADPRKIVPLGNRHNTAEFRAWFGESKCVDFKGQPLVLYHGTDRPLTQFDMDAGTGKTHGCGSFFSSNPSTASTYSNSREGGLVIPVYLSLQNPIIVYAEGSNWNRLSKDIKLDLPQIVVSDLEYELLEAELMDREPDRNATRVLKEKFLSLEDLFPNEFLFDDYFSTDDLARWARKVGYDGAIFKQVRDQGPIGQFSTEDSKQPADLFVAFRPTQIKSALANRGAFDPHSPDICA